MILRSAIKAALAAVAMVASVAALCPGTAHALAGPASFQIGDKLFDSFTCLGDCSGVTYAPSPTGFGVRFNPGFNLNAATAPNTSEDALLGFHVSVVGGAAKISDFLLSSNAAASGSGSVTDTLEICTSATCAPVTSIVLGSLLLTVPPANGINLADTAIPGGPYSQLWVFDDLGARVGSAPGVAAISRLDKLVTQTPIPEPASLALLGAGLLGMGLFRRRRKAG